MKKYVFLSLLALSTGSISLVSCNKNKCAECHYDKGNQEISLGEKCGEELENLESSGQYMVNDTLYTLLCGEH